MLEEKLRQADSLAIIVPSEAYIRQEADIVEEFVDKGGKLLLIADPTRPHNLNSLAERFGINFQPDYLYNMVDYDINFQDIFVTEFHPDEITSGLGQIALYTASSIKITGTALGVTDANTHSSIAELGESFYPLVKGTEGRVLAISDLTFMIPPQSSILDNGQLISDVADFLTSSDRTFVLTDFPYFFEDQLDILLGCASLFEVATQLKSLLATFQTSSEIRGIEDLGRDTIYLGLYEDSSNVVQYLDLAGVKIDGALRTPFTPDITTDWTAIMLLHKGIDRHVLVILGDSQFALQNMIGSRDWGRSGVA